MTFFLIPSSLLVTRPRFNYISPPYVSSPRSIGRLLPGSRGWLIIESSIEKRPLSGVPEFMSPAYIHHARFPWPAFRPSFQSHPPPPSSRFTPPRRAIAPTKQTLVLPDLSIRRRIRASDCGIVRILSAPGNLGPSALVSGFRGRVIHHHRGEYVRGRPDGP